MPSAEISEPLRISGPRLFEVAQNPIGGGLLDGPQNLRHFATGLGLKEQMDVLGHHYIGEELETQFFARPGERLQKKLRAPRVLEGGNAAVNGEGKQMQMSINVDRLALL